MSNDRLDTIKLQFEKFLTSVGTVLVQEKDISILQNRLRRHFNITSSTYLCSNEFHSSLTDTQRLFESNEKSIKHFTLLASLDKQLKDHPIEASTKASTTTNTIEATTPISLPAEPSVPSNSSTTTSVEDKRPASNLLNSCDEIELVLEQCSSSISVEMITTTSDQPSAARSAMKKERKILKLENRLSRLSRVIRELEKRDMSLDEMLHCDLYVVESNMKKQACELYERLVELKEQPMRIERILHQPLTLSATEIGHPLITEALEDLVNQAKFFPSFTDVLETVEKTNQKHHMQLSAEARKTLAEKSFKIIGKQIKERRMSDFHDIMRSRLPDDYDVDGDDPASHDAEMQRTLIENEHHARIRTEAVFEEFSQIDSNLGELVEIQSSEESSSDSGDTADNDEHHESEAETKPEDDRDEIVDVASAFEAASPMAGVIVERVESVDGRDAPEETVDASSKQRTFTVLSTASAPLKRASRYSSESNPDPGERDRSPTSGQGYFCSSSSTDQSDDRRVQTLTPRRRGPVSQSEKIYNLYQQRLTNQNSPVGQKRSLSKQTNCLIRKKAKQPELVVLD